MDKYRQRLEECPDTSRLLWLECPFDVAQGCRQIRLTIRYINQINQFKSDMEFCQINQFKYNVCTSDISEWRAATLDTPDYYRFALDVLAIPAMSTDCERAFSLAKLTVSSQRHSLLGSSIESIQLLKNWIRGGCVTLGGLCLSNKAVRSHG
ncbi:Uncharacterized protein HZ326_26324 [Fusarium oxysporum f. sp. albedinis]|nr:Uncharacterized protein HZ326_26324 [Fusarium oxysporum f. sp. albedinis]